MILPSVRGKYKEAYNIAHLTWFKVGGNADVLYKPSDEADLVDFLKQNNEKHPVMVLGAGSNMIIRDGGIEGFVVKLGGAFNDITITDDEVIAGAGCLNFNLAKMAQQNNISGFEFLVGIPGTIGGGVAMNAGAYGSEFKDIVKDIYALDSKGGQHKINASDAGFSYRKNSLSKDLIFTKATFYKKAGTSKEIAEKMQHISESRAKTQPITEKTGGSTFANPDVNKAWQLIDNAGMRGAKIGGASMSELHCNFMINDGSATALDMEQLGEEVRKKVKDHSGIDLHWEIKLIGKKKIIKNNYTLGV